ncbi:hypothetical protein SCP_0606650 [Sparassis crispa]|uniref:Uncharacterized protein n=1 Tax=Sparassis crispa TaxID=139825 RepID=A0A401GR43_9APHY|nr:hypothetical protein SCP_0606650 [Sparassis crispa]GBE84686.1 hypothetical protein SCP_0606650 [Sparassis crispa]
MQAFKLPQNATRPGLSSPSMQHGQHGLDHLMSRGRICSNPASRRRREYRRLPGGRLLDGRPSLDSCVRSVSLNACRFVLYDASSHLYGTILIAGLIDPLVFSRLEEPVQRSAAQQTSKHWARYDTLFDFHSPLNRKRLLSHHPSLSATGASRSARAPRTMDP